MKYELMVIIKPFLPEDIRIKLQNEIKLKITTNTGKIINEDIWGKRHLAYKIKSHEEGYYIIYELVISPKNLSIIKHDLRLINDLLRFMFVKK